jgi:hypothetical protein
VPAGLVCHVCPKIFLFQFLKPQHKKPRKKVPALVSREANWWDGSLRVGPTESRPPDHEEKPKRH